MRCYVPATSLDLQQLGLEFSKPIPIPTRPAHAVTKSLAASLPGSDQDELEWEAFCNAADDSALLVLADDAAAPLRAILSFDVPDQAIQAEAADSGGQLSRVNFAAETVGQLAAIHVDEPATFPLLQNLRENPTSASAHAVVIEADLLWYAPTEIGEIPLPK